MAELATELVESDHDRLFSLYEAIAAGSDHEKVALFVVPGDPWSKSRPRFARGRTYQPRDDYEAEQRLAGIFRRSVREPFTGNVALACIFYRSNAQRIDADNLLKHVCDSANGVLWKDDSQVTAIYGQVERDPDRPRTLIIVGRHASTMRRGSDAVAVCQNCGREFNIAGKPRRPYCTQRCARTGINGVDLSTPIPCPTCGASFKRQVSHQRFCSIPCARSAQRGVPRPHRRTKPPCVDCGGQVMRSGSKRCRPCFLANRRSA